MIFKAEYRKKLATPEEAAVDWVDYCAPTFLVQSWPISEEESSTAGILQHGM